MQARGVKKKEEMYSLGSSEALTQFLDQRLGLPFFSDVREELSENTKQSISTKRSKYLSS